MADVSTSPAGFPIDKQILLFNRQKLEDGYTLAYYNIQDGSTLHFVRNMRGNLDMKRP